MKLLKSSLVSLITLMSSISAMAITINDLKDSFLVGRLDIEGPYYVAEFAINKFGTALEFRDATMSASGIRPKGDCLGAFDLENKIVKVNVTCNSLNGNELNFEINLQNITAAQLNSSAGIRVQVRSKATQNQWMPFKIHKQATSFFATEVKNNEVPRVKGVDSCSAVYAAGLGHLFKGMATQIGDKETIHAGESTSDPFYTFSLALVNGVLVKKLIETQSQKEVSLNPIALKMDKVELYSTSQLSLYPEGVPGAMGSRRFIIIMCMDKDELH